jgi:SAM-dependent methyltransferase
VNNPWLHIPLADYEGHMASPAVAQAQLLSDVFAATLRQRRPASVAVLGCAGGNGFERVNPAITPRVVGVDVNPDYIRAARRRFADRLPGLELIVGDAQRETCSFEPVDLIFAGLLFEYVDIDATMARIAALLRPGGALASVAQLPDADVPAVTPTRYASLGALASIMRLAAPEKLTRAAAAHGLRETDAFTAAAAGGKQFRVQIFESDCALNR